MEKYTIFATDTFKEVYATLDNSEQIWITNIKAKLEENPTGKILKFSWFREKKYLNKRLYYLVDEQSKKILFVGFASKKDQQNIIDFVVTNMKGLLEYLRGQI